VGEPLSYSPAPELQDSSGDIESPDPSAHSRAVAEYIGDMITQLESMSRTAGFDLLAYLLSMARVEAETNARGIRGFGSEGPPR
jgi:hypothetical protein